MHFGQMLSTGQLQMWDFENAAKNVHCYGQNSPPVLDLTRIQSDDIHLIYSAGDLFADVKDVENLKKSLKGKQTCVCVCVCLPFSLGIEFQLCPQSPLTTNSSRERVQSADCRLVAHRFLDRIGNRQIHKPSGDRHARPSLHGSKPDNLEWTTPPAARLWSAQLPSEEQMRIRSPHFVNKS